MDGRKASIGAGDGSTARGLPGSSSLTAWRGGAVGGSGAADPWAGFVGLPGVRGEGGVVLAAAGLAGATFGAGEATTAGCGGGIDGGGGANTGGGAGDGAGWGSGGGRTGSGAVPAPAGSGWAGDSGDSGAVAVNGAGLSDRSSGGRRTTAKREGWDR